MKREQERNRTKRRNIMRARTELDYEVGMEREQERSRTRRRNGTRARKELD